MSLDRGLRVVFTGEHPNLDRADLIAHATCLGLEVQGGVTKNTDLLVAADPDTNSGKAGKARRYGIPVLGAQQFAGMRAGVLPPTTRTQA
ncbi:MAG: BRCT domain-containing protein [Acidimicrobiia bacterium]